MTTEITDAPGDSARAPLPPFDRELAPVVEMFVSLRAPDAPPGQHHRDASAGSWCGTDGARHGGAYSVEERSVPGPDGAPRISLLICLPKDAPTPTAAIYHMHGGGMIVGDNRFGPRRGARLGGAMGMAVDYRLAPETPHPARSRTATPVWRGCRPTPTSSTSTPAGSSSVARAPAAVCRRA